MKNNKINFNSTQDIPLSPHDSALESLESDDYSSNSIFDEADSIVSLISGGSEDSSCVVIEENSMKQSTKNIINKKTTQSSKRERNRSLRCSFCYHKHYRNNCKHKIWCNKDYDPNFI